MMVERIDISATLEKLKKQLGEEQTLSPALRSTIELLMLAVALLVNRLGRNSKNSSLPPSQDPHRKKTFKAKGKAGGQIGHKGRTLEKIDRPHVIEEISIDRRTIPPGDYTKTGYESRQVFDVTIGLCVTEYRAEVLQDALGRRYMAPFPDGVAKAAQYGNEVKAQSVYMSQFQLIPLNRVEAYFNDQVGLPISQGTIANLNQEAYDLLEPFEAWARKKLLEAKLIHADETSINRNGDTIWLHNLSHASVTLYHADEKRGKEGMDRMGVLPDYRGQVVHDHLKSYYRYEECDHNLCNSHHLRELERAWEEDHQKWARSLKQLLIKGNEAVSKAGGVLPKAEEMRYRKKYRKILKKGAEECPKPTPKAPGKRGRQKKARCLNLLERLRDFEDDGLRFMSVKEVPFTNNQAERDLRMTKVQQKISGCFRSMEGAKIFCRVRGFLSTCRKNKVSPTDALRDLFQGKLPAFMSG